MSVTTAEDQAALHGHDTLSPNCTEWVEYLMYSGAWCEICEGKRP